MRVSSAQILDTSIRSVQQHATDAVKYQRQISSGQKFQKASESPTAFAQGVYIQFDKAKYAMLKENQRMVGDRMAMADSHLAGIHRYLEELKTIGVAARNGAMDIGPYADQAAVILEALEQAAVAKGADGQRILLDMITPPRITPQVLVGSTLTANVLSPDAVFEEPGGYVITYPSSGNPTLKIDGKGPDGTINSSYEGRVSGSTIYFDQVEGKFANLSIPNVTRPGSGSQTYSFDANPFEIRLGDTTKVYQQGNYGVTLTVTSNQITSATISDGATIKTITNAVSGGITYDAATLTSTLNFGDAATDEFEGLVLTLKGDHAKFETNDIVRFSVADTPKSVEIEPGVFIDEGITFRSAMGNAVSGEKINVLEAARAFVAGLQTGAASSLPGNFATLQNTLADAADQVLNAQMRAGFLGAQIDAASESLERKDTELEVRRARILDTDIAEASANLVRSQTLLQAAQTIFSRLETLNLFQRLL